jgi:hypothetical protein
VSLGEVSKEQVVVVGVLLNPGLGLAILHHFVVSVGLEITRFVAEHGFLEITVVEDEGVLGPAAASSLLIERVEADSVAATDECYVIFRGKVKLAQLGNVVAIVDGLSLVLDDVGLAGDVQTAHSENHLGSSAVFDGGVATELNEVSVAHLSGQMVSLDSDLLDFSHSFLELLRLDSVLLTSEHERSTGASDGVVRVVERRIVDGSTEQLGHARLLVEEIKEWLLCNMIQVHYLIIINRDSNLPKKKTANAN